MAVIGFGREEERAVHEKQVKNNPMPVMEMPQEGQGQAIDISQLVPEGFNPKELKSAQYNLVIYNNDKASFEDVIGCLMSLDYNPMESIYIAKYVHENTYAKVFDIENEKSAKAIERFFNSRNVTAHVIKG